MLFTSRMHALLQRVSTSQVRLRQLYCWTLQQKQQDSGLRAHTWADPFGVDAGNAAKNVEIDRCPGVDVELRLVVM